MHGPGTYKVEDDGSVYEGEFVNDKRHGTGTYRYANGDVYKGEWKDGHQHGRGTRRTVIMEIRTKENL